MSTKAQALIGGAMDGYQFVDSVYKNEADKKRQAKRDKALDAASIFEKASDPNYKFSPKDVELLNEIGVELDSIESTAPDVNLMTRSVGDYLSGKNNASINTPEFLGAFNRTFKNKINRDYKAEGKDGIKITNKEVAFIMPGKDPGTVVFDLLITGEKDGKTIQYRAPATVNRSTDPNDNVKQIPIESVLGDLQSRALLANDPNARNQLRTSLKSLMVRGGIGAPQAAETYGDPVDIGNGLMIQYGKDNKAHVIGNASQRGRYGKGGSIPADQQMIEYYINVHKMEPDDAIGLVNSKNKRSHEELTADIYLKKMQYFGKFASPEEKQQMLKDSQEEAGIILNAKKPEPKTDPEKPVSEKADQNTQGAQDFKSYIDAKIK